ncbi:hypothetical protein O3Q52_05590 [Streptomyces sp. ActVer]|uniref:hypothetical protein n=1 Tax=Streptomyces sp. ActVer TaxID=3014558 RepID=UPI0022B39ED8|nr:hypothetical protein [Streptomyces sp. ActVer]MCZ4507690.1 hypothetical protein [Streptomyces sp. ActVer]
MTAGWCARTIRAAVFAAVCVLLAALGHVLMSGSTVPWWTMAAGFVATSAFGWCLAGRERGLTLVVSAVALAQGTLHWTFSLAPSGASGSGTDSVAQHMSGDPSGMPMGSTSMDAIDMASMDMGHSAPAGQLGPMAHDMGGTSSFGMLAAHTLAALLSGLWLAHGERAAFRVLRAVTGWLAAPLRLPIALPAVPHHRPRPRPTRERSERVPRLTLAHTIISRGPPAGTAVA